MSKIDFEKLLQIPEVIEEIKRHLWIESEKAGFDRGWDWARGDWLKKYAKVWIDYHKPFANVPLRPRRSVKSYFS